MNKNFYIDEISLIIWDWNGTLLNDAPLGVEAMNYLLNNYKLNPISLEHYKNVFDIPVQQYYEKVGFDFSKMSFEKIGLEFIEYYNRELSNFGLHHQVEQVLSFFQKRKIKQVVLSARKEAALKSDVAFFGIEHYFDELVGVNNDLGNGKIDLAVKYFTKTGYKPEQVVLIGDTIHDWEVAKAIGVHCLMLANGHHSKSRLEKIGVPVFEDLSQLKASLFPEKKLDNCSCR